MIKFLLTPFRVLWKLWFAINFVLTLILFYPVFYVFLSREKWFRQAFQLMRLWAKWLAYSSGIFPRIQVIGATSYTHPTPCIYVANHSSYLDIILSYVALSGYFIFIGKQELDKAPLFRIFFKKMNILVNRKNPIDAHRAFLRASEEVDKGNSVFIFPEATISPNGILKPFKNGAFKLAISKRVPIVPIIFPDNWKLLQNGGFLTANGRPGRPRIIICPPVETYACTEEDLVPLREKIRGIIHKHLYGESYS